MSMCVCVCVCGTTKTMVDVRARTETFLNFYEATAVPKLLYGHCQTLTKQ
jgi:hypothetical protein